MIAIVWYGYWMKNNSEYWCCCLALCKFDWCIIRWRIVNVPLVLISELCIQNNIIINIISLDYSNSSPFEATTLQKYLEDKVDSTNQNQMIASEWRQLRRQANNMELISTSVDINYHLLSMYNKATRRWKIIIEIKVITGNKSPMKLWVSCCWTKTLYKTFGGFFCNLKQQPHREQASVALRVRRKSYYIMGHV